jgi:hypothetical protein
MSMSHKKPPHRHASASAAPEIRPSLFSNTVLLSLAGLLAFFAAFYVWQSYQDSPAARRVELQQPPAAASSEQLQVLPGRWVRTDGGYVLNIKNTAADGKLEAEYLNPKPIHIARAEADVIDDKLRVYIEFQDKNYEGSTYDLRYEPVSKQLVGVYMQATQQQRYQVAFERAK